MTTNPKRAEINTNLEHGQQAINRPELVVRVFKQKTYKLMDLLKDGAFGELQAWLYSIELQRRSFKIVCFVCLFGLLTSLSTTMLYRGRAPRQIV